jgi:hypothetical protein
MPQLLKDLILFRGDRLFNGAVNIGWFGTDEERACVASTAFVFHGPAYHGVQQEDVGTAHGHRLVDTATLARSVVRRCYGLEDQPFTLAIAGYGTGKSHLGLTLASLLHSPDGETAHRVLSAIEAADAGIGGEIRAYLQETRQPCLVLTLNGMQSFDLAAEVTRQLVRVLKGDGHDPKPLDDLRPRFGQAAGLIRMSNEIVIKDLLEACGASTADELLTALDQQDERAYARVHEFFAARGMPIRALTGESVRDVVDIAVREYCGKDKAYRCLLVLFDEFGKYTEFATVRSQIAGSGALQDLFEAIQANANSACFVGFIQFELNAYMQRVAPEYKNEILRYVTRYQAANKVYLSINLETLIANLLEKRQPALLDKWFNNAESKRLSQVTMANIARWFPQSRNHRLWGDPEQFHAIIHKGCWPLSPYTTWCLFYLAAAGKHLQERSALSLLGDVFNRFETANVPRAGEWSLAPVDLWAEALQQELISAEEMGQQGSIAHAYASVISRHGASLSAELQRLLRAVVLASKLGLQAGDRGEAIQALGELAGVPVAKADEGVELLQNEYNVLEWDQSFRAFDILGDAVPRNQFLAFVRHRVASVYDEAGKAKLFASKAAAWCDLLCDLDCDFAEENRITTREWRYQAVTSNPDFLLQQITMASVRWAEAVGVDDPRGTVVYTYVEPSRDPSAILSEVARVLRSTAREAGVSVIPILVVLLCDEDGALGQALAEYAVLEESISEEDRVRFGNLIGAHREKLQRVIREQIETMIKQRRYATGLREELESQRLGPAGRELFSRIYRTPIQFPFDGFSTAKGNAADTCQELTMELLLGKLDYEGAIAKPVKSKNRAVTVLKETWGIFTKHGDVSRRPTNPIIRLITEKWDGALAGDNKRLSIEESIRLLCRPPYGANIASAGLLFGVFVAPRSEKLLVMRNGQQLAISQCIQDGMFRGKFIDLAALHDVDLILLGEGSAEWEMLLDEWEQCDNHLARKSCLERCIELKARVPVPPALAYHEVHLREQAGTALEALTKMDNAQNEAASKVEQGEERSDVGLLTWGAAVLKELCEKMLAEKPAWTDSQIAEIQPYYERARQAAIQLLPEWVVRQSPRTDLPDAIGEFKHKMLHLVGGNLKKLGLEDQYRQVEIRTLQIIRQAETVAEARQLIRDVQSWLTAHGDAMRVVRVAELRGFRDVAKEYSRKLQGMGERIQIPEIAQVRTRLSDFLAKVKEAEASIVDRASLLWEEKIRVEDDFVRLMAEVDALVMAFENVPNDLEDLQLMRNALRLYQRAYQRLSDENLTWAELEGLMAEIRKEIGAAFVEKELPWPPDKTIDGFLHDISRHRKDLSAVWIGVLEKDSAGIATMSASEANRLHTRLSNPPAILTDSHAKRLGLIDKNLTARLEVLSVEWLVEKFKELPAKSKKEFLCRVREIIGDK